MLNNLINKDSKGEEQAIILALFMFLWGFIYRFILTYKTSYVIIIALPFGEVAEWSKAQHWKCCEVQASVSSNLILSSTSEQVTLVPIFFVIS